MRALAVTVAAFIIGCGGSATTVGTSSTPPGDNGSNGGGGTSGGGGTTGGGGGTTGGGGGGMPGGGGGGGGSGGAGGGGGGDGGGGGAACTLTGPTKLADSHAIRKIVVDGDTVYFLDVASAFAGVYRMPKHGGTPELVSRVRSIQDDGTGFDFVVDDRSVYVTYSILDSTPNANSVTVVDKTSLASRTVAARPSGCTVPVIEELAAYGGTLWMTQVNYVNPWSGCTDQGSGSLEMLAPGAAQSTMLATIETGRTPILADQTHVFWGHSLGIFRALHDGSSIEKLGDDVAYQINSNGDTLFINDDKTIFAIPAPGQRIGYYLDGKTIWSTAVDGRWVYAATDFGIIAVDTTDGSKHGIPGDGSSTPAVAVDATNIYYSTGGTLLTICKP
jgi:hypothetical protein